VDISRQGGSWLQAERKAFSWSEVGILGQICEKRLLASSCMSYHPQGTTRFPMDGFS